MTAFRWPTIVCEYGHVSLYLCKIIFVCDTAMLLELHVQYSMDSVRTKVFECNIRHCTKIIRGVRAEKREGYLYLGKIMLQSDVFTAVKGLFFYPDLFYFRVPFTPFVGIPSLAVLSCTPAGLIQANLLFSLIPKEGSCTGPVLQPTPNLASSVMLPTHYQHLPIYVLKVMSHIFCA